MGKADARRKGKKKGRAVLAQPSTPTTWMVPFNKESSWTAWYCTVDMRPPNDPRGPLMCGREARLAYAVMDMESGYRTEHRCREHL